MDYHADFRKEYSSESRCEKDAEDLRDRAYRAGERFLENLSSTLDYSYQEALAKELTKWKVQVQQTLDAYGKKKPSDCISVSSGNFRCNIYLNNTEAVRCGGLVSHINHLIDDKILHWSGQKIVGSDVQYMSKYDCKIKVYESDCDYRNALFGDRIIKYNIKYSYDVHVEDFKWSAEKVSSVCTEKLNNSEFLKADFQKIKLSFVDGYTKFSILMIRIFTGTMSIVIVKINVNKCLSKYRHKKRTSKKESQCVFALAFPVPVVSGSSLSVRSVWIG